MRASFDSSRCLLSFVSNSKQWRSQLKNNISIYFNINSANGFLYKKAQKKSESVWIISILLQQLKKNREKYITLADEHETI